MKIRKAALVLAMVAGMAFAGGAAARAQGASCDPDVIYVAAIENKAFSVQDKYWGNPKTFGTTLSYLMAYRMMWVTGKMVKVLEGLPSPLLKPDGTIDADVLKKLVPQHPGCWIIAGQVESAVVNTKKSAKIVSRKKFMFDATSRLALVDLSSGRIAINDVFHGEHEASSLPEELLNKDRQKYFPADPVAVGGNPLGVPFSRMFNTFAQKALAVMQPAK